MIFLILLLSVWDAEAETGLLSVEEPVLLFQNKCIKDLGCFYTGPPFFHPIFRPISVAPTSNLRTKYMLYTPSNPTKPETLEQTKESLDSSSFDPSLPVKVLIHGFNFELKAGDWYYRMKDAFLKEDDYNVIILDWKKNNRPPYHKAVANARAVGAQVANMLKFIMAEKGVQPSQIHVIGHSLGSHLSGWVGERIPNLGRITGLDPAGPYFLKADNRVRLDKTDAVFLDVIHTDGKGLGLKEAIGHLDFYPNGGEKQKGCILFLSESLEEAAANEMHESPFRMCNHMRALDYYIESINNTQCRFNAVECDRYGAFLLGKCPPSRSMLAEMGYHAQKIPGVSTGAQFFLRTDGKSPFCRAKGEYAKDK